MAPRLAIGPRQGPRSAPTTHQIPRFGGDAMGPLLQQQWANEAKACLRQRRFRHKEASPPPPPPHLPEPHTPNDLERAFSRGGVSKMHAAASVHENHWAAWLRTRADESAQARTSTNTSCLLNGGFVHNVLDPPSTTDSTNICCSGLPPINPVRQQAFFDDPCECSEPREQTSAEGCRSLVALPPQSLHCCHCAAPGRQCDQRPTPRKRRRSRESLDAQGNRRQHVAKPKRQQPSERSTSWQIRPLRKCPCTTMHKPNIPRATHSYGLAVGRSADLLFPDKGARKGRPADRPTTSLPTRRSPMGACCGEMVRSVSLRQVAAQPKTIRERSPPWCARWRAARPRKQFGRLCAGPDALRCRR